MTVSANPCRIRLLQKLRWTQIAQLVEQRTENPRVTGSIPVLGILDGEFMKSKPPSFCYGDEEDAHRACTNEHMTTANQSEIREAYLGSVMATRKKEKSTWKNH